MHKTITSAANPLFKRVNALHEKKFRARDGLFLAEGMRIVVEAVDSGHIPEILILAPGIADHPAMRRVINMCRQDVTEMTEMTPELLTRLTRKDNPQNVVGVFRQALTPLRQLDRARAHIWFVLEAIKDPGNLGTILRTADAVGAGGVILLDQGCDPFSVEAVRSSMGALFTQTVATAAWPEFLAWLREGPGFLVGASLKTSVDYQAVAYPDPTFLLMGNEQSGLPQAYEDACDALVKLPMRGKADSLNVAIATAVLAYEVINQRKHGFDSDATAS